MWGSFKQDKNALATILSAKMTMATIRVHTYSMRSGRKKSGRAGEKEVATRASNLKDVI